MNHPDDEITVGLSAYPDEGMYLIFPGTSRLILTLNNISQVTERFWNEIDLSSGNLKQAIDFQRCAFCPLSGKEDFCDALRPILPFLDIMETFDSFTEVTAIYRESAKQLYPFRERPCKMRFNMYRS